MERGLAESLVRRFKAVVAEPAMRRALVRETILLLDPPSVAGLLDHLMASRDDPAARAAWLDAVLVLLLDPAVVAGKRAGARASLPDAAVWTFLDDPPPSKPTGPPPPYDLDDVPLGVRKARARGRDRDDLRRIAADPDPSVIRILLENPVLTEADVLHAASLRPQVAPIFEEIVSSVRFGAREAVQAAMVLNPWCPARIALALLPLLPRTRLREVAAMTRLSAEVRAAATGLAG